MVGQMLKMRNDQLIGKENPANSLRLERSLAPRPGARYTLANYIVGERSA